MKSVHVAVGVVLDGDKVFVCRRAADVHQGNLWEFPGGKVEQDESEEQALYRELEEEIGITASSSSQLITLNHEYTDKAVTLHVRCIKDYEGVPHGKEGQPAEWRHISALQKEDFPQANVAIIDALKAKYV